MIDTHPFTTECHNAEANGGAATAFVISDPDIDTPNEIHVYLSLLTKIEGTVRTKGGELWQVKDSHIQKLTSAPLKR